MLLQRTRAIHTFEICTQPCIPLDGKVCLAIHSQCSRMTTTKVVEQELGCLLEVVHVPGALMIMECTDGIVVLPPLYRNNWTRTLYWHPFSPQ
jgi:hypothetical protein